jgi:hypothetical protein
VEPLLPPPRRSSSLSGAVLTLPFTEVQPPTLDASVAQSAPRRTNSLLWIAWIAAGMAVVAVTGGGLLYVATPRPEQVVINVTDARGHAVDHVRIFVDGHERCQTAPCVDEVSTGVHEVKVLCDGYDPPAVRAVAVGAGKPNTAGFTLFPANPPPASKTPEAADPPAISATAPVVPSPKRTKAAPPVTRPQPAQSVASAHVAPACSVSVTYDPEGEPRFEKVCK